MEAIHGLLDAAATASPEATAVRDSQSVLSYAQLDRLSRAAAWRLARHGVSRGDRVVADAVPDRRLPALMYACSRIGAAFVPLNPALKADERRHILADSEPALVVTDGPAPGDTAPWPTQRLESVCAAPAADSGDPPGTRIRTDDVALLMYTSGSTARPKAVVCPHGPVLFATSSIASRLRYRAQDVVFNRLPLSFDYGLYQIFLAAYARAELVLAGPHDDARLLVAVRRTGATVVPVVPALAAMLVKLGGRGGPRPAVRLFTNTGEELTTADCAALRAAFPGAQVQLMFGTTECKRVSIMEPDGDLTRPGSVGSALPGTAIRIVGEDGRTLPPLAVGEIVVSGPHLMAGYWRCPQLTDRAFRVDPQSGERSMHTGDYGHLDTAGYLYFHGRRDDRFKSNGVRTGLLEIERAARQVPGVMEAGAVPPPRSGRATLYVAGDVTADAVRRALRSLLEPAKVPGAVRVLDSLPRGVNGKIDRPALRALAEERP
ncbi:class I adenylate-forming enzyme family protein [Streptomyces sp. NPDC020192]|uniref:class I adenylate-forming enzyme family protein n=1 Tax=Streptomyces sp. NPDC020192 TaxID=3365066 RepID=UPI0037875793